MQDYVDETAGPKWLILKELSAKPSSPKRLADKRNTTIANMSQQLKLLEAYGYVRKQRVDSGKGGRKGKDARIVYSIVKSQIVISAISPTAVGKHEIKATSDNQYIVSLLLLELKDELPYFLKFYVDHEKLFSTMDAFFMLKREKDDVHVLVLTDNLSEFRENKSKLELTYNEKRLNLRFWSHTTQEFKEGLSRKEKYFTDHWSNARLLFEKKPGLVHTLEGGA